MDAAAEALEAQGITFRTAAERHRMIRAYMIGWAIGQRDAQAIAEAQAQMAAERAP